MSMWQALFAGNEGQFHHMLIATLMVNGLKCSNIHLTNVANKNSYNHYRKMRSNKTPLLVRKLQKHSQT